jgi:hypothetical protein
LNRFSDLDLPDDESKLNTVRKILSFIPRINLRALEQVLLLLYDVQSYEEKNRMSCANLAIVFAPNIFKIPISSVESLNDSAKCTRLLNWMIINTPSLFQSIPSEYVERRISLPNLRDQYESSRHRKSDPVICFPPPPTSLP